jgi:Protein of unknown function (DUF5132)
MALFEDMFKGNVATFAVVGAAVPLAPTLLPAVGRVLRPLAKEAAKTGITLYEQARDTFVEMTGDLVAEARAELDQHQPGAAMAADRAAAGDKPDEAVGTSAAEATPT